MPPHVHRLGAVGSRGRLSGRLASGSPALGQALVLAWRAGVGLLGLLAAIQLWAGQTPRLVPLEGAVRVEPQSEDFVRKAQVLRRFYYGPAVQGQSNHYLDLWPGQTLRSLLEAAGLTNNQALFINAHGQAVGQGPTRQFVIYPDASLLRAGEPVPRYTLREIAELLGPAAASIHNLVVSACNLEGALCSREFRRYFVNATNITYCPAGQVGYQAMFHQALLMCSAQIQPRYAQVDRSASGDLKHRLGTRPRRGTWVVRPYVAELFLPGATEPFRVQVAGRELLQPGSGADQMRPVSAVAPGSSVRWRKP